MSRIRKTGAWLYFIISLLLGAAVLWDGWGGPVFAAAAPVFKWRMQTVDPPALVGPSITVPAFLENVKKMSNGRLEISLFTAGQLVPTVEIIKALKSGMVDMAYTNGVYYTGAIPEAALDVSLMVWDVQGQRNDPLLTRYFAGAEGALFVCDLTRFSTFENLPEWIKDFDAMCGNVPKILLGNKADLLDSAQFGESELAALAARYNARAYLTSAKTGANVERSFNELARAITA